MIIPNITPPPKKLITITKKKKKNMKNNQKVTNWGPRQGCAQWKNDLGSQKGSMLSKPNSIKTNTNKKVPDSIRGIGYIFNQFPSTFKHRTAKPLCKVLRVTMVNKLS